MKLPCEMMEDLLPLYAEDMVTDTTRAAVEEHLKDCETCGRKLDMMRQDMTEAAVALPLEPVRREIRLRRWHAVIAAVCAVAAMLVTIIAWQSTMTFISYSACEISVETLADGRTEIQYIGPRGLREWNFDGVLYVAPLGSRDQRGGQVTQSISDKKAVVFVDVTKDGETTLIWGELPEEDKGLAQVMPRLALGYYLIIALVMAVLLLAVWYPLRRRRIGRAAKRLGILALCYAVAHFLVMGTVSMSFDMRRDFGFIAVIALLLWGLASSGERLIRQMRQDRQ